MFLKYLISMWKRAAALICHHRPGGNGSLPVFPMFPFDALSSLPVSLSPSLTLCLPPSLSVLPLTVL